MKVPHSIPEKYRTTFMRVRDDLLAIHLHWKLYRQLFGKGSKRIELLNISASSFFARLQWILQGDVMLGLCRLTDPIASCGKENLVLLSLPEILDPQHQQLADQLRAKHKTVLNVCARFREHRNKALAHRDKNIALSQNVSLPGISREMIEAALEQTRDYLNHFQAHFGGGMVAYEFMSTKNDGEALVNALATAAHYKVLVAEGKIDRLEFVRRSEYRGA